MKEHPEQQEPLSRPYEIVLLAFYYFQPQQGAEVNIDETGLVRCMRATHCPSDAVAKRILQNMVQEGLLQRAIVSGKTVYSRTALGIERTPPPPSGQIPRTTPLN